MAYVLKPIKPEHECLLIIEKMLKEEHNSLQSRSNSLLAGLVVLESSRYAAQSLVNDAGIVYGTESDEYHAAKDKLLQVEQNIIDSPTSTELEKLYTKMDFICDMILQYKFLRQEIMGALEFSITSERSDFREWYLQEHGWRAGITMNPHTGDYHSKYILGTYKDSTFEAIPNVLRYFYPTDQNGSYEFTLSVDKLCFTTFEYYTVLYENGEYTLSECSTNRNPKILVQNSTELSEIIAKIDSNILRGSK